MPYAGQRSRKCSGVYFVRLGETGPVRIGFSSNIDRHLPKIFRQNFQPIHVLAFYEGSRRIERIMRKRFRADRIAKGLYELSPDMQAYLARSWGNLARDGRLERQRAPMPRKRKLPSYTKAMMNPVRRCRLPPRSAVYPHRIKTNWSLGYSRTRTEAGCWVARVRIDDNRLRTHTLAIADDHEDADGVDFMTFDQALACAKDWCGRASRSRIPQPDKRTGVQRDLIISPVGPVYTVGHVVFEYIKWARVHHAKSTFRVMLSLLNRFAVPMLAHVAVDDLSPQHFYDLMRYVESTPKQWLLRRRGRLIDPETLDPESRRRRRQCANNVAGIVRCALEKAWEEGKAENPLPWRRVKLYRKVYRPRPEMLSQEQCRKLIQHCNPDIRNLVLGGLYTGCRVTELKNMEVGDLRKDRVAIYIRPSKFQQGRTIALPDSGYSFFRTLGEGRKPHERLFVHESGKPWLISNHCQKFRRAADKAGLPKSVVFHTLRHTYASNRLQEGISPIAVARQLGHRSIHTVMEIYGHCADDLIDRDIRDRFRPLPLKGIKVS